MDLLMQGVKLTPLKHISTPKGDVFHAMKATDDGYCGFGEVYFSEVFPSERKGWKRHNEMTLNIVVVSGAIRFIIYDDREGSTTKGQFLDLILNHKGLAAADLDKLKDSEIFEIAKKEGLYARLTVAPGLWMAFEGVSDSVSLLMDLIPQQHDPAEADRKELSEIKY